MKLFLILMICAINTGFANTDYNNSAIDIEGVYSSPPTAKQRRTQAERLKLVRQRLEQQTEQMINKKIEMIRFQREAELTKRLEKVFIQQMDALNNI